MAGPHLVQNATGRDVRRGNITAARAVADAVRTSLGPKGMDKMLMDAKKEVLITNDGATIMDKLALAHPAARMLVDLSKSQDIEAGDGTTSVVVIAGALLEAAENLLNMGVHPQEVTRAFMLAQVEGEKILDKMAMKIDIQDRDSLLIAAKTSLNSKVVSENSDVIAPIAVDSVRRLLHRAESGDDSGDRGYVDNVDLRDVHIVSRLGGTVDDSLLVQGLVMGQRLSKVAGGPSRIQNGKVGLIQFCLSPPKTDMESKVEVKNYAEMDRILKEERIILAKMVKTIAKTGCNVLLIQKSILRDAVTDLSLDFLAKMKILVVRDVERDDVDYLSRILGVTPAASLDSFSADKLGNVGSVREEFFGSGLGSVVRFEDIAAKSKCVSVLLRASNQLILDEAERSLHDALCVVRSLVKERALIPGGSAPEMELSVGLARKAETLSGTQAACVRAFADALEVISLTLAENAGLVPLDITSECRKAHAEGNETFGINVRTKKVSCMKEEGVLQPLLVSKSILRMATETVRLIMKIDDVVMTR